MPLSPQVHSRQIWDVVCVGQGKVESEGGETSGEVLTVLTNTRYVMLLQECD